MRIAVITSVSTPYFRARFRAAAALPGVTIDSVELSRLSSDYAFDPVDGAADFERHILSNHPGEVASGRRIACLLDAHFRSHRPDLLGVPGWIIPNAFAAIQWALPARVPVILMSESTRDDFARHPLKEWVKRRAVSLASSALAGGSPHRDYLRHLGMADDRIFDGYDAVDNATFASESERWREADGPQPPYFLASNRFIPKKNLPRLLSAYARHAASPSAIRSPWPLVLLGDGEEKASLRAHAGALGLSLQEGAPWERAAAAGPCVYWPGFRQIEELPRFYAHAGAFVHASTTEQWGLVVNEAMACGLPVIVSNRCGCAPDLVKEGKNGWTFDPLDDVALAGLLERVGALDDAERARLGQSSREIIADWGPERFVSGLKAAAEKAIEVGPKRAGMIDRMMLKVLATR